MRQWNKETRKKRGQETKREKEEKKNETNKERRRKKRRGGVPVSRCLGYDKEKAGNLQERYGRSMRMKLGGT